IQTAVRAQGLVQSTPGAQGFQQPTGLGLVDVTTRHELGQVHLVGVSHLRHPNLQDHGTGGSI
ncbi:MAG: hypothetical protein RIT40_115, partial [Planctomycetota bacterium]